MCKLLFEATKLARTPRTNEDKALILLEHFEQSL